MTEKEISRRELIKAEYDRIKSEQAQRIGFRDNMIFVNLAAMGAIASWSLTNITPTKDGQSSPYAVYALLVIPWVGIILGWTYAVNDHLISRMGKYVRIVLSRRAKLISDVPESVPVIEEDKTTHKIDDFFGWEPFHRNDHLRIPRKRLQLAVDLVTFLLPGVVAIIGFFHISHWNPSAEVTKWTLGDAAVMIMLVPEVLGILILGWYICTTSDQVRGVPHEETTPPAAPAAS